MEFEKRKPKILAISSGGGHWIQLMSINRALAGMNVVYASVNTCYRTDVGNAEFHVIPDGNFSQKWNLLRVVVSAILLVCRTKPDVVISTGAAPGFLVAFIAKLRGSRIIWIDSIANADELSMSGRNASLFCDLWLTQWPHLARKRGPHYIGSII
jgi:UDP-N-acetylglucosamine:LPS N-acetylglucosamine transferase